MIDEMAAVIDDKPGRLMRALGARWTERSRRGKFTGWRMRWGEVCFERPGLALELALFGDDNHFSLILGLLLVRVYIRLPLHGPDFDGSQGHPSWGFSTFESSVHLRWGQRCKIIYFPWDWGACVRHDVLDVDGKWVPYVGSWEAKQQRKDGSWSEGKEPDRRATETHPYRYVLRSGQIQERKATIYVEEREWRWRWLRWLPFPRKIRRCISVEFDGEVGERAGSWKGGVLGTGYLMRPDETPRECLRRMERDEKFT